MKKMSVIGRVVAILIVLHYAEAQTVHIVGGGTAWRVPQDASFYRNWASANNFRVGDILSFNFQTGQHNVVEVRNNNSCSSENPIGTISTTGPTNITLTRSGEHYYICSIGTHCTSGQRLAISVSDSASALPPATTTAPPPPSSSASTTFPISIYFFFFYTFMTIAF